MYNMYHPPKKKKKYWNILFVIIIVCYIGTGLWFGGSWLERQKWQDREDGYNNIKNQIEDLEDEKDVLQDSYHVLQAGNQQLQDSYDSIQTESQQLQDSYDSLQTESEQLQDSYDSLQTAYQQLLDNSFKDEFEALQTSYQQLEDQKDSLQNDYDTWIDWYDCISEEVNRRLGISEDKKLFITPDDEKVATMVQEITGGFSEDVDEQWNDLLNMYYWVRLHIDYNSDSHLPYLPSVNESIYWTQEYWRMPGETLDDRDGDCEDMATLLASMIINYFSGAEYPCWCISWSSNSAAHVAVAIQLEEDRLTILDPAGHYHTGSWFSIQSDDVSVAVDDWFDHWEPEPGIRVSYVFSDTVYQTFYTTEEFVDWALNV